MKIISDNYHNLFFALNIVFMLLLFAYPYKRNLKMLSELITGDFDQY